VSLYVDGAVFANAHVLVNDMNIRLRVLTSILGLVLTCAPAMAHPHVWVVMKSQIVYDKAGLMTGIRHVWVFDDVYSAFITQGIKPKSKGSFTREELAPVAKENVDSLRDDEYFTRATINGRRAIFGAPIEYWFEQNDGSLTLNFTLPLKSAAKLQTMELVIYDPLYYLDFSFPEKESALPHAPPSCKLTVSKGQEIIAAPGQSAKDAYVKEVDAKGYGWQFATFVNVECP
jgi:ABC-type uncharacterized transport system substrate-binding protein